MPSVPQEPIGHAPTVKPLDPNSAHDSSGHAIPTSISHQPSPAVVSSSSHVDVHVPSRRFLGPMPENVINSNETQEKRRHLRQLRRKALYALRDNEEEEEGEDAIDEEFIDRKGVRKAAHNLRERVRRGAELLPIEVEDEDDSSDSEADNDSKKRKGKRKKRNDVWVGDSFDIGREFKSAPPRPPPIEDNQHGSAGESSGEPARPTNISRSTQESFVTARTKFSTPSASRSSLNVDNQEPQGYHLDPNLKINPSPSSTNRDVLVPEGTSVSSSLQPLMTIGGDTEETGSKVSKKQSGSLKTVPPGLKYKLKSAIRNQSPSPDTRRNTVRADKAKTVQFPADLQQSEADGGKIRKGNKKPVDPEAVLSREGDEAAGTSAGASEDALQEVDDEEGEEEVTFVPGEVILRDRMLVKVAHHREENLSRFDEAIQRRSPCSRMEPMEEFIGVWRQGRVELYQDWGTRLTERMKGQKRLYFIIPLEPARTSLSIFNRTDLTLALTTSAGRLNNYMEQIERSNTTRTSSIKDRVKQSRQAKWLRHGRQGTHVFVIKLAERSRALDWYWELWRELGGELPSRFDIQVPSLVTSVRLVIPPDDDVGGRKTRRLLNRREIIDTCFEMMKETVDVEDLLRQRSEKDGELRLELAWKSDDGTLDWIVRDTNVTGEKRDWAVLAGIAEASNERCPRSLQLRPARHQPRNLLLEDGTYLEEPPGIEGYLVRHKTANAAKGRIYATTYDGNIFICGQGSAHPPLMPKAESSSPGDLFPQVQASFRADEMKRASRLIEHSTGCIDLRDIVEVKLCDGNHHSSNKRNTNTDEQADGSTSHPEGVDSRNSKSFQVTLKDGFVDRFEAHGPEIAMEWVERLKSLIAYWTRRHRVEARIRMDAISMHAHNDVFSGTGMSNISDDVLGDVWDWCVIEGCRPVCLSGRLFMKSRQWGKFRAKYIVLTGGCLVSFKIKSKKALITRQKSYPLFGAYTYSGMLAQDELHEAISGDAFTAQARVYQDGLQSSDGAEDTTFCVRLSTAPKRWGKTRTHPWDLEPEMEFLPPPLSKAPPRLLIFRARSKLERDRWVWAINNEMERQVRNHPEQEESLRQVGQIPHK